MNAVKGPEGVRVRLSRLCQEPCHPSPGHLAEGSFFRQGTIRLPAEENTPDHTHRSGQRIEDRPAVLPGGKVQHRVGFLCQCPGQTVPPEGIEIPAVLHPEPGLHLQPVGHNPIQGPEQSIEA